LENYTGHGVIFKVDVYCRKQGRKTCALWGIS